MPRRSQRLRPFERVEIDYHLLDLQASDELGSKTWLHPTILIDTATGSIFKMALSSAPPHPHRKTSKKASRVSEEKVELPKRVFVDRGLKTRPNNPFEWINQDEDDLSASERRP